MKKNRVVRLTALLLVCLVLGSTFGPTQTTQAASLLPAPSLSNPSNGLSGVSTTPTFSWSSVSGANYYWLTVATSASYLPTNTSATSAPNCVIGSNGVGISATSYQPSSPLSAGVTYYWEVQAYHGSDASHPDQQGYYSQQRSFTTQAAVTLLPAPTVMSFSVTPATVALGNSFTASFSVTDSSGSGLKQVEMWRANDSGGSPGTWAQVTSRPVSGNSYSGSFSDTPSSGGSYWYGIHAVDNANNWAAEPTPVKVTVTTPDTTPPKPSTQYVLTIFLNRFGNVSVSPFGEDGAGRPTMSISSTTGLIDANLHYFKAGTQVTLEAKASTGYKFNQWEGTYTGTRNPLTITIDRDMEIGACFIHESIDGTIQVANLDDDGVELTFLGRAIREVVAAQTISGTEKQIQEQLSLITELARKIESHPTDKVRYIIREKTEEQEVIEGVATNFAEKLAEWATVGAGAALLPPPFSIASVATYVVAELATMYGPMIVERLIMGTIGTVELHEAGKGSIWVTYDRESMKAIVNVDLFVDNPQRIQMVIPFKPAFEGTAGSTIPAYPWGYTIDWTTVWFHYTAVNVMQVKGGSPVEIRVLDPKGRVTGIRNGEVIAEIPGSTYYEGTVRILYLPQLCQPDSYKYEVKGISQGTYALEVTSMTQESTKTFTALKVSTSSNAVHQYTVDWNVLSKGEKGATMEIDSDGDGAFERTLYLTSAGEGKVGVPLWIWIVASALVAFTVALIVSLSLRRKQNPQS